MLGARTGKTVLKPHWERTLAAVRVLLTLGLLLALFFLFGLTPGRLANAIADADGLQLGFALVLISALMLLLSLKWYLIAKGLNIRVTFSFATRLYLISTVLNNVLPTAIGGDLYRVYFLSRQGNTTFKRSLASVIIERATSYAGLLLLSAAAACFYFLGFLPGIAVSLSLLALLAVTYLVLARFRGPNPAGEENESGGWWGWWRSPSAASNLYGVAVLSVVQQSLWITVAVILGLAYDVSVPWSYWALAVTAITMLTLLPVSVGGLGLREVGYVAVLAPLDVEVSKAATIGLAMGFGPPLVSLLGLLALTVAGLRSQSSPSLPIGEIEDSEPERIG